MELFKHQCDIIDLAPDKHLLAWGTGTGKTRTAIELADKKSGGEYKLVICPKSLVDNWKDEIVRWSKELGWDVISKEQFKKKCLGLKGADTLIIDEAHYFGNYKSQLTKSLYEYDAIRRPNHIYALTATPYLSSPWNIYSLAKILGHEWNWYKFKKYFFYDIKMGNRRIPVIKRGIEKQIAELVNKLGSTVRLEDCFDVPEQIFQNEYFELTTEQRKAINDLTDILPIVRFTKEHQICGGSLKGDGYEPTRHYACEKRDRLLELIKEHRSIMVVCRYNAEINHLYETIKEQYPSRDTFRITGDTTNRHEVVGKIISSDSCIVLVNGACSEGYGLPNIPIMVFYSYDFSLKNYIQILGRIQRAGHIKKNIYLSLITKGTIDEGIYKKVVCEKQDFHLEIYANKNN